METDETNELGVLIANEIKPLYLNNRPKKDWPSEARKGYISWETFFIKLAILTKERSTHPEHQVNKINLCTIIIVIHI